MAFFKSDSVYGQEIYAKSLYCSAHTLFFKSCAACIERIGSLLLPGTVWNAGALANGNEICCDPFCCDADTWSANVADGPT